MNSITFILSALVVLILVFGNQKISKSYKKIFIDNICHLNNKERIYDVFIKTLYSNKFIIGEIVQSQKDNGDNSLTLFISINYLLFDKIKYYNNDDLIDCKMVKLDTFNDLEFNVKNAKDQFFLGEFNNIEDIKKIISEIENNSICEFSYKKLMLNINYPEPLMGGIL